MSAANRTHEKGALPARVEAQGRVAETRPSSDSEEETRASAGLHLRPGPQRGGGGLPGRLSSAATVPACPLAGVRFLTRLKLGAGLSSEWCHKPLPSVSWQMGFQRGQAAHCLICPLLSDAEVCGFGVLQPRHPEHDPPAGGRLRRALKWGCHSGVPAVRQAVKLPGPQGAASEGPLLFAVTTDNDHGSSSCPS